MRKIKRGGAVAEVSDDYVLQKGEEEVTETTDTEKKPDDTEETPEEKALLDKIKSVVTKTVNGELAASRQKYLVGEKDGDGAENPIVKTFSPTHKAMWEREATPEGKKNLEQLVEIQRYLKALYDNDRVALKALSEGTDSAGGYLVPTVLATRIYDIVIAQGYARREMTTLEMTSKTLDLATLVTKPVIYYVAEGAQITASDMVFGKKVLTATKMAGIAPMSNEVLEDSQVNLIDFQIQKFAEAFMEEEDKAFFNTSSSANITGLLEDTGVTLTTMAATKVDFADLTYDNLVDIVQAIGSRQRAGAKWCMSSYVVGLVMKMKDSNNMPIWNRPVAEGQPATLLGYPVIENDKMPGLADTAVSTKFIVFGNFKDYIIGDRKTVTAKVLTEGTVATINLAEKDSSALRVVQRVAGLAPTPAQFSVIRTAAA